ncbi:hypothetical protein BH10BAC1_BH10BAC1_19410 [soil metagenome]
MKEAITILHQLDLATSEVNFRSDGIVNLHIKPNQSLNVGDTKKMIEFIGEIGNGKKFLLLITSGKYALADKDAREFGASEAGNEFTLAAAIVVKSLAQKLLGNAYIKVNKPIAPNTLFTSEEKAIDWLKTFL